MSQPGIHIFAWTILVGTGIVLVIIIALALGVSQ